MTAVKMPKRKKIRHNEYYSTQDMFDDLYERSNNGFIFKDLVTLIASERNIELAYRNIKKNKGSKTPGTNSSTIMDIAQLGNEELVKYVRKRLQNFIPHSVRRKEIPKGDGSGKVRPLGIPTMEDRLVQQCILQVLEPICEAKFHPHSYGFRPNRGTKHAIARANFLINKNKLHYVVDIDIKGFFDNVNHAKLIKQLWSLGIRDKNLICILSKLLKAPIEGIGKQDKGTPQGGIISPLLSNVVLNELDWWISSQWETFETKKNYGKVRSNTTGGTYVDQSHKYRALRSTSMKEVYIVRYADDFKLFCRDYVTAQRMFIAVKQWLKERLDLDISPEKSKVINLRKNYSHFLGIKIKAKQKGSGYVACSHISDKSRRKVTNSLRERIKEVQRKPDVKSVGRLNATILGMQNYYKVATNVNIDFSSIEFSISKTLYNRFRKLISKDGLISKAYSTYYKGYGREPTYVRGVALFPISGVKNKPPSMFVRDVCNYTAKGRELIHRSLQQVDWYTLKHIMENPVRDQTVEFNDNRISLYVSQKGLCQIMKTALMIGYMHCHHKKPKAMGGTDAYSNLTFLDVNVHRLIHATDVETIKRYKDILNPNDKQLREINKLRKMAGNMNIE